ncbi:O-acyltransferase like protein-like [Anneissia japonica]|uniref:O-acyltransferase like protein-like n=1 Tax=Anneissia japonica TaxID=1529436 RepID=UPI0014256F4A|nr:O-acyltransferase like protein-like [Anneissia japonica]
MYWTWYLANDMQFYFISPLLLLVLYRSKYLGISLVATLCTASIITTCVLMGVNQFSNAFKGSMDTRPGGEDYSSVVYDKPYCRITPYLIGMLLGYAMARLKTNNQRVKLSPIAVFVGWTFSIALLTTVAFGLYGSYHGDPMTVVARALYEGLSRFTWSVALSWVVFACFYGYGGWVNQLLSSGLWVPLSRLVFNAYLVHPIMIKVFIFSMFEPIHYSYTMMIFYYFAFILSSFMVAMYIFLVVELPFSNLVELFTTKKYRKEGPKANEENNARRKQCDEQV